MDRYEDALGRAREMYQEMTARGVAGMAENIAKIFPELAESEDERIRKFLKDYAIEMIAGLESDISISVYDGVKGHDPEAEAELEKWRSARAWLEKQKEQKPAEWSEEDEKNFRSVRRLLEEQAEDPRYEEELKLLAWWDKKHFLLRPQPRWKPSEEDIRTILDIENEIIHECNKEGKLVISKYQTGDGYYGEILNRFMKTKA